MSIAELKAHFIEVFKTSTFIYYDDIPMDGEIAEFIYELNKCARIITTNSCAGHDKFESNADYDFISHPYLAFIVDEIGWNLFWEIVLPEISSECLIHVSCYPHEKHAIIIRAHYDDKKAFWGAVKPTFLKYFHHDQRRNKSRL